MAYGTLRLITWYEYDKRKLFFRIMTLVWMIDHMLVPMQTC